MLKKHLKGLAKTDSGAFVRPEPRPKPSSQRNASESKIGSGGSGRGTFKATRCVDFASAFCALYALCVGLFVLCL